MIVFASDPIDVAMYAALARVLATSTAPKYLRDATDPTTLKAALVRYLATTSAPKYLRDAAAPWLAKQT